MHRRTSRLNHLALVLLGLVLLAAAAFLFARYYGWVDRLPKTDRLYTASQARWLHGHDWIWFAVAAAAVVVGLLTLRWLLVQPRLDRVGSLRLDPDASQRGRTTMASDVLTDMIEDDLVEYPGVTRARVLMGGAADEPELIVRVSAHPVTDLAELRRAIVGDALPAARTALDAPDAPAQVHLHIAGRRTARRIVI